MNRALLVIDVQNEYFTGKLPVTHPPGSLEKIGNAMDAASASGVPVVVVQHAVEGRPVFRKGSPEWALHPEVAKRPCDLLVEKSLPGSFTGTNLEAWLRERNIDTVVISGYMTQMCCDTTARQAFHLGFGVEFLSDATGTLSVANDAGTVTAEELHRAILVTQGQPPGSGLPFCHSSRKGNLQGQVCLSAIQAERLDPAPHMTPNFTIQ